MSKIVGLIVTMLLLNVAMFVFTFTGDCPDGGCKLEDYNSEANSTMWEYFTNPQDMSINDADSVTTFWERLFSSKAGILGLLTLAGAAVAAGVYITKDINVVYISLMIFLVAAAIGTWARLYTLVNNESFILGGQSGGVVAMIVVGCLLAVQLFNAIDWGRGKD